ncbi:multifunctional oxoglutarate decarboxylase/oxoglutarate dehydrogenase thiamine pyrophosphate-binding subunit/dihydrolipoyllysine-residue succinyltransferase subunit [Gulosibacter molinativorax]|uniref:Multifunctional oxoglutarate decarboxylase/oxoglutarate dehydrogenase thiamine pyrophosphate-binding subunit/dihydrolipoyllysine-residue succinyltransferase subunit n=2 Tax=Gulosibacter molinativorax TaxID=256821 RepID=A0ABT7C573_9MICO|nr:multifunctional oxoglutarate decarboxylase/oxoglutarate dehydrogenase thiamine pyrophosphate-binding subunit/dihydrolipoyllysine-residue succinyltransferase subunit [Gulosibacter molinativorax]QUY61883.1 Alpha-ketoglutarate decarboxylase [Gulosibacter molinativorax]
MSTPTSGLETPSNMPDYGANDWLVAEMYAKFQEDKNSVDEAWWPTLERYDAAQKQQRNGTTTATQVKAPPAPPAAPTGEPGKTQAKTTARPARQQPIPAEAPTAKKESAPERQATVEPLKGMSKAIAKNMDISLEIPTATSYREIPAKLMIDNRIVINNHLRRTRGGKISFTHMLGYAIVQALKMFPSQNVYYDIVDGKPTMVTPAHINLGIAIDVSNKDGSRGLVVPSIKQAEDMNFREFVDAYEQLIAKGRKGTLTAADHGGATISLTNPGGIGTVQSAPRLTKGQGAIIGAGALDYPSAFQGMAQETIDQMAISKRMTVSSTYDHRVIQGAGSGEFLKIVSELLTGGHNFYEEIFSSLRIPYRPIKWSKDVHVDLASAVNKTARVQQVINMYRVRGHMMADIDPLEYVQRTHPDLEIESHGLTFWDLEREFVTAGFGTKRMMKLRDILGILRDTYCRTIGIEYMHIQDPGQRAWFQSELEHPYVPPTHEEQLRILRKLNEAEAFETFLQTKYVGQKRFSLEGSESVIALLDQIAADATEAELSEVAIGMAHRGRLNVLTNIAGKTYNQVFREFEGAKAGKVTGTGDVKYHLGIEGTYTAPDGREMPIYLAANPSHLEAVDGVLEGIVRGKQDRYGERNYSVLPVLVHGDAAMSGQGIVYETLQMSQLRGYRTGGTIHVIINNQVGFTTTPQDGRTSMYASDVAKAIQAPIFHVNGDDPEAVARVGQLAFKYRQEFNSDVVIDLVSYRRRGHNEGDDASMTQPLMFDLIEAKRSVRRIYADNLVGRGDLSIEEYETAQAEFHGELEKAFAETHNAHTESITAAELSTVGSRESQIASVPETTGVNRELVEAIGDAHQNVPEGFTVHPKLQRVLDARFRMTREGGIDWAFGELLALGSLLTEGTPVRFSGQDSRRGTFTQRHALLHDRLTDQNWLPLQNIQDNQARFSIYDSLLSEYAVLGFEYGYSVERPDALVLWEAQFGDFVNGAQTIIDEFISSGEQKWSQHSSVVMLLPHGYEGQGPDHSSGRIERFLTLAAQDNMTVSMPSTPANYFHLLRRQAYARPRKPLVVFTPKSMLRLRGATSFVEDFTSGRFRPVLDDTRITDTAAVRRVVIHSGKLHYDLKQQLEKNGDTSIALVRLEQYYPLPLEELQGVLARYPNAELVWAQEEPANQGAWPFLQSSLLPHLDRPVRGVTRPEASAPSVGTMKAHQQQQADVISAAIS